MTDTLNLLKTVINEDFIIKDNFGRILYPENINILNNLKDIYFFPRDILNTYYDANNKKWYEITIHNFTHKNKDFTIQIFHNKTNDVLQYKAREKELSVDALTNIYLRGKTFNKIVEYISIAKNNNEEFCLTIVDVDNFKKINDNYGHDRGDEVLKFVANTLYTGIRNSRNNDIVGRIGGDEFIILFKNIEIDNVNNRLQQLKYQINNGINNTNISCSFGSYFVEKKELLNIENANIFCNQIYILADKALYKSKETGKNKICILKKTLIN